MSASAATVAAASDGDEEEVRLVEIKNRMRGAIKVSDRSYLLKSYPKVFVGSEAVRWMLSEQVVQSRDDAVHLGNAMMQCGLFHHVTRDHVFRDDKYYYRFTEDAPDRGHVAPEYMGENMSWSKYVEPVGSGTASNALPNLMRRERKANGDDDDDGDDDVASIPAGAFERLEVTPLDEHNARLLNNCHPLGWVNPQPPSRGTKYNMVVIGAGTGGLVTAISAAGVGARVALIERHLTGGDCLNTGCVPSKALLKCAKVAHEVRRAAEYGVRIDGEVRVDFPAVMERMRRLRAQISANDSAARFAKLGVDVYLGHATFVTKHSVSVNGSVLEFQRACIASGASAAVPSVEGLSSLLYLTNTSLFNLTALPPRMAVLGAGPIGCELAQAFQRFGCQCTVFARRGRILPKEEEAAATLVQQSMEDDGVVFQLSARLKRCVVVVPANTDDPDPAVNRPFPLIRVEYEVHGRMVSVECDAVLVSTGRAPNVADMGLEVAGVQYTKTEGIVVNDHLQTTQKHIYAVGDCCTAYQFTHMADFMARMVIRNALFYQRAKWTSLVVPWCTYTDPEVAHVGLYVSDLRERGVEFREFVRPFEHVDRCILDGRTVGWVQIFTNAAGKILGATVVGDRAGDLISEISVALQYDITMVQLSTVIHPYPTQAEAIRQCGDMVNKGRLTPFVKSIFRSLMSFQRL